MKKWITLAAAAVLLLGCVGCSQELPEAPTEAPTEPTVYREPLATMKETILYSENDIKITATGLVQTTNGGEILVTMENGTEHGVSFAADDMIVNGLTITDGFCIEAPAGKTVHSSIEIRYRSLDNAGLTNIATVESTDARIFENEEFKTLYTAPFRLTTSAEGSYELPELENGTEVYNKDGIRVSLLGFRCGKRTTITRILVTNETDRDIALKAEKITIDDKNVSAWLFDTVYADTSRYCTMEVAGIDMTAIVVDLDLYAVSGGSKELLTKAGTFTIDPAD